MFAPVSFLVSAPETTMQRYLEITSWATFLTGVPNCFMVQEQLLKVVNNKAPVYC